MGPTYRERLKGKVTCVKCREMLVVGYLSGHMMTHHGKAAEIQQQRSTPVAGIGPQIYRMYLPAKGGLQKCPVAGCLGRVATRTEMRVHFVHRHVLDTVVILEEGNFPHPRCAWCVILVSRRALNRRHLVTE